MTNRIAVLGRGPLAYVAASHFHQVGNLAAVVTVKDEPTWEPKLSELMKTGPMRDIPVYNSHESLRGPFMQAWSIFYDRILPPSLLNRIELPMNLHPAPLPKYRGVRPINWALKNGERVHGVTIHQMTEGVDDGPIYGQITFPIWPEVDEVIDVYRRMLYLAESLFFIVAKKVGQIEPYEQDEEAATIHYSSENGLLGERSDWTRKLSVA